MESNILTYKGNTTHPQQQLTSPRSKFLNYNCRQVGQMIWPDRQNVTDDVRRNLNFLVAKFTNEHQLPFNPN